MSEDGLTTTVGYYPKMGLPMYVEIGYPEHDSIEEGVVHEVRARDGGEFKSQHNALVVSARKQRVRDIHPYLLALAAHSEDMDMVRRRISPTSEKIDRDREVFVVVYLRMDKVEEFVADSDNFEPVIKHPDEIKDEDYDPVIGTRYRKEKDNQ